jgi:hypothetical protein
MRIIIIIIITTRAYSRSVQELRELSGVLRLAKAERPKSLHNNKDDTRVKCCTWEMDKVWSSKHTLRIYGALTYDEAPILVQARTEHYRLNACLFWKNGSEELKAYC